MPPDLPPRAAVGSSYDGPRLPGIGSHHAANPKTDEWLTPPHILEDVGPFDLDPCAPHQRPDWTGCATAYTATDDGLSLPWAGSVWCNPPYSNAGAWMERMALHDNGIALVFARCDTSWWFEHVWPRTSGLLFLKGRLTFYRPDATPARAGKNSGGPSVLIAYGTVGANRLLTSRLPGAFVRGPAGIRG